MKQVLTIAGSDSGGGAGIQADLKAMTAFKVYGASVITAVTAQNTLGVQGFEVVSPHLVGEQLESVLSDLNFGAAKTGMLANSETIEVIAEKIEKYQLDNLVLDPVMVSTSGDLLLAREAITTLKERLIPQAKIITPNFREAKVLVDKESDDFKELAKDLYQLGSEYILLKGGHGQEDHAVDILYNGEDFEEFKVKRIDTKNTHGTGCTLSAAIASNLALGFNMKEAVQRSKDYITKAIKEGIEVGGGINPVNHLVELSDSTAKSHDL